MDGAVVEGLLECVASTILYGSAFVPIKPFKFGDGIFSLQIRSVAILLVGLVTFLWSGQPEFYPLVMVGGAFWAIANLIALPCIGQLGLGITVLLYSFTNCVTNWVTGNFGLFGTKPRPPHIVWLNYLGLIGLLIGGVLIAFIRPTPKSKTILPDIDVTTIVASPKIQILGQLEEGGQSPTPSTTATLTTVSYGMKNWKQIAAVLFSLLAGFFYGENVTPAIYVQDQIANAPQDGLSYCFSHFMGIFATSSVIFAFYCVFKKNQPFVNPELSLPSFISGLIWGIAQTLFMVSVKRLSQSVSGPIGAIFPACVAACWSVFYFKEIKGRRNLSLLCASISITAAGAICIALSKNL